MMNIPMTQRTKDKRISAIPSSFRPALIVILLTWITGLKFALTPDSFGGGARSGIAAAIVIIIVIIIAAIVVVVAIIIVVVGLIVGLAVNFLVIGTVSTAQIISDVSAVVDIIAVVAAVAVVVEVATAIGIGNQSQWIIGIIAFSVGLYLICQMG